MFVSCSALGKRQCRRHGHPPFIETPGHRSSAPMVASIGKVASPAQGVSYFERDGLLRVRRSAPLGASTWAGKGAALGLAGPVEPEAFQRVLEGEVPGGYRLGRKENDGTIHHRSDRDAVGAEVGVAHGHGGRRRTDRRRARQGSRQDPRLDRGQRRRDPDARPGDQGDGARRGSAASPNGSPGGGRARPPSTCMVNQNPARWSRPCWRRAFSR